MTKRRSWMKTWAHHQGRIRCLGLELLEPRQMMAGECLPTGPVVAELTRCRNFVVYAPSQPYNPNINVQPTEAQMRLDLEQLYGEGFRGVITYTLDGPLSQVPRIAKEIGFEKVIAGLFWFDSAQLQRELAALPPADLYVDAYVVGNEGLTAQPPRYSLPDLVAQMAAVRDLTGKPVTTTETFLQYQNHPALIAAGDWMFPNLQPWFNSGLNPGDIPGMVQAVVNEVTALEQLSDERIVVVKETWWPTGGPAHATPENQVAYFQQLASRDLFFVWPEPYDQPWKSEPSPFGTLGPTWGMHQSDRTPKPIVSALASVYRGPYFQTRELLPGAIRFLRQMTLPSGLPQNEATAQELQTLSDSNNSIATNNRFFNPAQAGFWLTSLFLAHELRRSDASFGAGLTTGELIAELTATIGALEDIADSAGGVYRSQPGPGPQGIAFYQNYDSIAAQPRTGAQDRRVPLIDNGYLAVGLLTTAAYLLRIIQLPGSDDLPTVELLALSQRARALAERINFALWFEPAPAQFRLGDTDNPLGGSIVDRITSESRLIPVLALAREQITPEAFDAVVDKLVRESRTGERTAGAPAVERLSAFGTALEALVPTLFLSSEMESLFGQGTIAQGVVAALEAGAALGLPASGAMGVANGGAAAINGGVNTYVNFGLSPAELPEGDFNRRDEEVLTPTAAALMMAATSRIFNPHLLESGVAAARNLGAVVEQLAGAGQLHGTYGAPNYLDFGSELVNSANPVRGFLEIGQLAAALLNDELGGGYLETLLRQDAGWRESLAAYRRQLDVREMEFEADGPGGRIIRGNASGGFNLLASADTDGGVWHLNSPGQEARYRLAVGAAGLYEVRFRYSNDDTGALDQIQVLVNGEQVGAFTTADTDNWNQFTQTAWIPLGELLPSNFDLTVRLAATDGFGIDFDTLTLRSAPRNHHNDRDIRDVNGDTFVSAIDALLIINHLEEFTSHPLPAPPPTGAVPPFLDVDGDGHVAPRDAIIIINRLNESAVLAPSAAPPQQSEPAAFMLDDDLLALLADDWLRPKRARNQAR